MMTCCFSPFSSVNCSLSASEYFVHRGKIFPTSIDFSSTSSSPHLGHDFTSAISLFIAHEHFGHRKIKSSPDLVSTWNSWVLLVVKSPPAATVLYALRPQRSKILL